MSWDDVPLLTKGHYDKDALYYKWLNAYNTDVKKDEPIF